MRNFRAPFSLRPAGEEDDQQIRAFIRQEKLNPAGLNWQRFTVAVSDTEKIIGCVQYKPHHPQTVELASLVVAPEWRKQGVGKALVEHLQQQIGPPLWLMCVGRTAAYYEPFGFEIISRPGDMPAYFRRMVRIFNIFRPFVRPENRLTIMLWSSPALSDLA